MKVTRDPRGEETVRARYVDSVDYLCFACRFFLKKNFLNSDIHFLICSGQGKPLKNAGWDFSITGSQSTGTVRSVVRPPPVRERRPENLYNHAAQRRTLESGNQWLPTSGNANHALPEVYSGKNAREAYHNEHQDNFHDDVSISLSLSLSFV